MSTQKYIYHPASSRGIADHGWLKSRHTFSFANYYDPERMNFGALRVLNDDIVAPSAGFGQHPHQNMEIISIPLQGSLLHKDTMGNEEVIEHGAIQVMSAGTGIYHSEHNYSKEEEVRFLQIWILPNQQNVPPRYDRVLLANHDFKNKITTVISPRNMGKNADDKIWIHQDAYFSIGKFDQPTTIPYTAHQAHNGVYFFVLKGEVEVDNFSLTQRDGLGVWPDFQEDIQIKAQANSEILVMEVPPITA